MSIFPAKEMIAQLQSRFTDARNDYNAAHKGRFRRSRTGVSSIGRNADYHYYRERDYLYAMETARDIDRNDMVVGQGIDRLVTNVIRHGFLLDTKTGDKGIDAELKSRWQEWANNADSCDLSGEHNFSSLERIAFRSSVVDGDNFPILMRDGCIDIMEAHRVRTPYNSLRNVREKAIHGVELGEHRRRLRLWVTKDDINPLEPLTRAKDVEKIDFYDRRTGERVVLQVYQPRRKTQTRGFTSLAPIVDPAGMHDDIQFATMVQRQVASCFAILRSRSSAITMPPQQSMSVGETSTDVGSRGSLRTLSDIGPGMEIESQAGETISGFSPNIPSPEFFPHAMMILTFISINLGLPVAVLLLDPSRTNFSGWRGAMDQAKLGFQELQHNLVARFHRPIYLWKIGQWVAQDPALRSAIERGVDVYGHAWHPPAWDYIEPSKDATADLIQTRNSLTSRRRIAMRRGLGDWDDLAVEIVEDNAILSVAAFEKAKELNATYPGMDIGWRELAYTPTPDGVTLKMQVGEVNSGDGETNDTIPSGSQRDG